MRARGFVERFKLSVSAGLLASFALAAQAAPLTQTSAELRMFGLETSTSSGGGYQGRDIFTNGNPLSGMVYAQKVGGNITNTTITGGYTANPGTFSAGSELTGLAPFGLGVGGLNFAAQDAALFSSNLTPAGYNSKQLSLNVKYLDPRPPDSVPGANYEGVLGKTVGWDAFTVWDYVLPSAGASYGLRVNGVGVPNTQIFNDLLDLRVVTDLSGTTTVNFERVARNASGIVSRASLGSVPLSAAYSGNLANVDFIILSLHRGTPMNSTDNQAVHAGFGLYDVTGTSVDELGNYEFADTAAIYTNGTSALASARATWLELATPVDSTVPEPGSLALLSLSLGALGWSRRRPSSLPTMR